MRIDEELIRVIRRRGQLPVTVDREQLKYLLPFAPAVFFVLPRTLTRAVFLEGIEVLAGAASRCDTPASPEDHWRDIQARLEGAGRWDKVAGPLVVNPQGVDELKRASASVQHVPNILHHRAFTAYTVNKIQYVLDVFNPRDELELGYREAGQTVVSVLLHEIEFRAVSRELSGNEEFFAILRSLADRLGARVVRGTYGIAAVMLAYASGRLSRGTSPWDLLYPLSVLNKPADLPRPGGTPGGARTESDSLALLWPVLANPNWRQAPLARFFSRIEPWGGTRLLVFIGSGLTAVIGSEYQEAGRVLGMTAVQELLSGPA